MLFTTPEFIFIFLPVCLLIVGITKHYIGHKSAYAALSFASLFFYAQWNLSDVPVIVLSIAVNFVVAHFLSVIQKGPRLSLLIFGVTTNIMALLYYKYTNFILINAGYKSINIILPLGISFFTFQQIAFIVDIYRADIKKMPVTNYAVTVLFFPHLIAGPLIHYKAIMAQFEHKLSVNITNILLGIPVFSIGLAKKLALADPISTIVSPIFQKSQSGPLEFFEGWVASLGYTAQLYFDFSGYSDMAIGIALMFGITLPVNFNSPYRAASIIEFWKRWHISLSLFLRDYLYIPLGGNRVSRARWYVNLLMVMCIGGFWHGAGWNYLIWGGLHGSFLVVNNMWRRNVPDQIRESLLLRPICFVITFLCVVLAWIFFRAPDISSAINIINGMIGNTNASLPGEFGMYADVKNGYPFGILYNGAGINFPNLCSILIYLVVAYAIIWIFPNSDRITKVRRRITEKIEHNSIYMKDAIRAMMVGFLIWASAFGVFGAMQSEFLYFQF